MASGYLYVVSHPELGRGERKIGASCFHPVEICARWERAGWTQGPLRLHSFAFFADIDAARTLVQESLAEANARCARAGKASLERVMRKYLVRAMRQAVEQDRKQLRSLFMERSGLFADPAMRLSGPPARLVREIGGQLAPFGGQSNPDLYLTPYSVGLIWSLVEQRANELAIPGAFVPEMYRSIARQVWGKRPSNQDMGAIIGIIRAAPADFRMGRFDYTTFIRGPISRNALDPDALARLRDFLLDPAKHVAATFDTYAVRHYNHPRMGLTRTFICFNRAIVLAAALMGLEILSQGAGGDALIRTAFVGFVLGLALFHFGFFRRPDAAGFLGLIAERDWLRMRPNLGDEITPAFALPKTRREATLVPEHATVPQRRRPPY